MVTDTWTLFDRLAPAYDEVIPFFRGFADQLIGFLDPSPGTRLLDIGCGRGAIAVPAAARGCVVTAVDAAPTMIELLAAAHPEIDARVMDAHHLDLPDDAYDIATGGFMIHLVSDPAQVIAELRRVLRPGGTVALSMPGGCEDDGRWDAFNDLAKEFRGREIRPGRLGRDIDPDELLEEAGFTNVQELEHEVHIPVADPETCWRFQMSHGFAAGVAALSPADAAEFEQRALAEFAAMRDAGGIIMDRGSWIVTATAP